MEHEANENASRVVATSVRLPESMVKWLDAHAAENVRSRNQEIEFLLIKGMKLVKEKEAREEADLVLRPHPVGNAEKATG